MGNTGIGAINSYMEIYLATEDGINKDKFTDADYGMLKDFRLKLLLSFFYYQKADIDELVAKIKLSTKLFFDSGAYSALTLKKPIRIDDYIRFCHKYAHLTSIFANLDVIGDATKTLENQRIMESNGLTPIPVYHHGSPFSFLEYYYEKYDYIALGGMVGAKTAELKKFTVECFIRKRKHQKSGRTIRLHGFGITNWALLKGLPFYSVDSSSWTQSFRYGTVTLFDSQYGRWIQINLRDINRAHKYQKLIAEYGISPNDIGLHSKYDRGKIGAVSMMAWLKAEVWLNKKKVAIYLANSAPHSSIESATHLLSTRFRLCEVGTKEI